MFPANGNYVVGESVETVHKAEAVSTVSPQTDGKNMVKKTCPFNYKFLSVADEIQQQQISERKVLALHL